MPRGRKPTVNYEKRHEWLQRNRRGETPPSIANKDGYDKRTVRKNIDLARHEAETGEARTMAFRDALQQHQVDLCTLATKLDSAVTAEEDVSEIMKERIAKALTQHLPVSRLWKDFDKWNNLLLDREKLREELIRRIQKTAAVDSIKIEYFAQNSNLAEGLARALAFQADQWSKGLTGFDLKRDLHLETSGTGVTTGRYGAFDIGLLKGEEVSLVQKIISRLESDMVTWPEYTKLQKTEDEIRGLKDNLQDELAVITMRRIVPGSCRYCPD